MSLFESIKEYIKDGFHNTTDEQRKERADICSKCEYNQGILCQKCSCFINVKICIASESCPEKKWLRVDGKPTFLSPKKGCKGCNNKK